MNRAENLQVVEDLPAEQRDIYYNWKELYRQTLNPAPLPEIQTIIVPTGGWLERADMGLSLFTISSHHEGRPNLFITGENGSQMRRQLGDTLGKASDIERAIRWFGGLNSEEKSRIVVDDLATNTKEQAINVYKSLKEGRFHGPLAVTVSDWHLPRWYMTMIQEIIKHEGYDFHTRLYSFSVDGRLQDATKDDPDKNRLERIYGEMERIHRYQAQGDVASFEDLNKYTSWLNRE